MTLIFQILAVILGGVAAYFLWNDNFDWAFALGVLSACSYLIGMRFQIKARLEARKVAETAANFEDED